jgi:hypothetical protein
MTPLTLQPALKPDVNYGDKEVPTWTTRPRRHSVVEGEIFFEKEANAKEYNEYLQCTQRCQ